MDIKIICYKSDGSVLQAMYQWDKNRTIKFGGFAIVDGFSYKVHFCNRNSTTAYAVVPTITDDLLIAQVPADLLEKHDVIAAFIYATNTTTNEMNVIGAASIPVIPRSKPYGYIYEHDDGIIKVADGFIIDGTMLYLAANGQKVGDGVNLSGLQGGGAAAGLTMPQIYGAAADAAGVTTIIEEGTA